MMTIGRTFFIISCYLLIFCCNNPMISLVGAFKPSKLISCATRKISSTVSCNNKATTSIDTLSSLQKITHVTKILELRGGAVEVEIESDEEESDEESDDDNELESQNDEISLTTKALSIVGDTIMTIMKIITNLITSTSSSSNSSGKSSSKSLASSKNEIVESYKDFGEYLSTVYDCIDDYEDEDDESRVTIEGGSLTNVLIKARSNARLLVIFIPALTKAPKKGGGKKSNDQIAIQSIFSADVNVAAERKSRKKEKYGSFMFWSTKADSPEATKAMKRLKVTKKSKHCPTLMVVYPAQAMDSSGKFKIAPKVLAQHHCNPPPSSTSMSSWLDSLRKRHAKQYAAMHKELREIAFMKERTEGYESSMKQDRERVEEEAKEEARRLEEEKLKKEKEEYLMERRKTLLESLPEEPSAVGEGIITIALRFSDGRTGQRRFTDDTEVNVLCNWVDALFEMEREQVVLTTMNGKQSFSYDEKDDATLSDAGLGKLVAFRVSVKETNEDKDDAGEKDEEE